MIRIRSAKEKDFNELYGLGRNTPELQVSASGEFMEPDEFRLAINDPGNVFLVAEFNRAPVGFIYATTDDKDRPLPFY